MVGGRIVYYDMYEEMLASKSQKTSTKLHSSSGNSGFMLEKLLLTVVIWGSSN